MPEAEHSERTPSIPGYRGTVQRVLPVPSTPRSGVPSPFGRGKSEYPQELPRPTTNWYEDPSIRVPQPREPRPQEPVWTWKARAPRFHPSRIEVSCDSPGYSTPNRSPSRSTRPPNPIPEKHRGTVQFAPTPSFQEPTNCGPYPDEKGHQVPLEVADSAVCEEPGGISGLDRLPRANGPVE